MRQRPAYKANHQVYRADTCDTLVEAAQRGAVKLEALVRGHYPGRPLGRDELPRVKSVGFWDAAGPQDWGLDWHRNEGLELTYLESGSAHFATQAATHCLNPGEMTITRPWQAHRVGDPNVGPGRLHWLIIDLGVRRPDQPWQWPAWVVLHRRDLDRLTMILRQNEQPVWIVSGEVQRCWKQIARAVEADRQGSHISHLATYINELLLLMLEMFDSQRVSLDVRLISTQRSVKLFLEELAGDVHRLSHPWTVTEMAEHCGLGLTQFTALCKQIVNQTPNHYLTHCRIHAAVRMLRDPRGLSITQIAHRCGFSSSQYFAKVLREHTGRTPTQVRLATD